MTRKINQKETEVNEMKKKFAHTSIFLVKSKWIYDRYDLTRKKINGNGSKRDNKTVCAHAAIFSREIELSQFVADFSDVSDSQKTPE